jgi:cbb3-type cytochrome c oxidase subunit III
MSRLLFYCVIISMTLLAGCNNTISQVQGDIDSNPKFKAKGIAAKVINSDNGYFTIMVKGFGPRVTEAINEGQDFGMIAMFVSMDIALLSDMEGILKKRPDVKGITWKAEVGDVTPQNPPQTRNDLDKEKKYARNFDKLLKQDVMKVAANPEAKEMGAQLFQTHCARCHESDAKGKPGFPNLTDNDWLWGGTTEKIKETIKHGRANICVPKGTKPDMNADQVKDVVAYVRSFSGLNADSERVQRGKGLYLEACAACHRPDGKGNQGAGYPNLTDKTWLYGSSEATMIEGVSNGHRNECPHFHDLLDDAKIHLLTAYVWGLGGGVKSTITR